MTQPIVLELRGQPLAYQPGEVLAGFFRIVGPEAKDCRVAEFSVLWYTEGKGDEDMAVHYFDRFEADTANELDLGRPQHFQVELPPSPLSYDGVILRIRWCARLRAFFSRGKESVAERPFNLGNLPSARLVRP